MVNPVTGFIAKDGTFFEVRNEAELYEADQALTDALTERGVDPDKFIEHAVALRLLVERYFNAKEAIDNDKEPEFVTWHGNQANLGEHDAHDGGTKEGLDTLLEQPSSSDQPVPNVGRRSQSKKVRDNSKGDGS